jgi:hypothetical protein
MIGSVLLLLGLAGSTTSAGWCRSRCLRGCSSAPRRPAAPASAELAFTRRLIDCKLSCWPVIAVTAGITLGADPLSGLVAGSLSEALRRAVLRIIRKRSET